MLFQPIRVCVVSELCFKKGSNVGLFEINCCNVHGLYFQDGALFTKFLTPFSILMLNFTKLALN